MGRFCVYALLDPRQGNKIFYIGKGTWRDGKTFKERYYEHIAFAKNNGEGPTYNKIRKIVRLGFKVGFVVLSQWKQEDDAYSEERRIITEIGLSNLTNQTEGGWGCHGHEMSAETKQKISIANQGRKQSPEHLRALSLVRKGRKMSEEFREKCRARFKNPEFVLKLRAAASKANIGNKHTLGYKHTEEAREKILLALKKRYPAKRPKTITHKPPKQEAINSQKKDYKISEETKQKISVALKGRPKTAEHRENIRLSKLGNTSRLGHKNTEEHRQRLLEGQKIYWQNKPLKERGLSREVKYRMTLAQQKRRLMESREKLIVVLQQIAA